MLSKDEVLAQSEAAFSQWGETWKANARENGKRYKKDGRRHKDFYFVGAGKSLLCVANGPSFEKNIALLKNTEIDIACVDKCMGNLIDNGVVPKYVVLADAGIDYNIWCKKWEEQTKDITLVANITCNPVWVNNWKGPVVFYVNKDNIETEKIYMAESGCNDLIPASSNVGNTVVVFSSLLFGYDEYLLLGYDFCWKDTENYYAFLDSDKRYWMKHVQAIDKNGDVVNTSSNLLFSARWLNDFYLGVASKQVYKIYDCSGQGILNIPSGDLVKKLNDYKPRKVTVQEKNFIASKKMETVMVSPETTQEELNKLLKSLPVVNMQINYIPTEVEKWLKHDI